MGRIIRHDRGCAFMAHLGAQPCDCSVGYPLVVETPEMGDERMYTLEAHEPDVLRQLRGLTDQQYEEVLVAIHGYGMPVGREVESIHLGSMVGVVRDVVRVQYAVESALASLGKNPGQASNG